MRERKDEESCGDWSKYERLLFEGKIQDQIDQVLESVVLGRYLLGNHLEPRFF